MKIMPLSTLLQRTAAGLAVTLCLLVGQVRAEDPLVVVTSAANMLVPLSREEIAALFLGESHVMNGREPLVALDQSDEKSRQLFYTSVTRRTLIQVRAHWARMVFTGNGRPPKQFDVDELVRRLQHQSGIVTYLPLSQAKGFTVLMTIQKDLDPDTAGP